MSIFHSPFTFYRQKSLDFNEFSRADKVIHVQMLVACLVGLTCPNRAGSEAEADRTHTERETYPASCQLSLPGATGALF